MELDARNVMELKGVEQIQLDTELVMLQDDDDAQLSVSELMK